MTRRKMVIALAGTPAAAAQATPQAPADEDLLELARRQMRETGQRLTRYSVPMATEPAFQFKA